MLKIFDPTTEPVSGKLALVPRFGTLNGLKMGVLWNGRPSGAKILPRVMELLKAKYSINVVDFLEKKYFGNIAPEEFFEKLVSDNADAVIVGVGD